MTNPLDLIPKHAFKAKIDDDGKFKPKLDFNERCSILALVMSGVDRRVVAVAFGVDRRTVGHVVNKQSVHYKDVRREYARMGHDAFVAAHLTEQAALKVAAAASDPAVFKTDSQIREETGVSVPSARAAKMAGIHVVKPEQCEYSHRIEVKWMDGDGGYPKGWHFRDLDSKSTPELWLHNGDESLLTSQACLKMAEANLTDD